MREALSLLHVEYSNAKVQNVCRNSGDASQRCSSFGRQAAHQNIEHVGEHLPRGSNVAGTQLRHVVIRDIERGAGEL